jgi:hypothetical protein
MPIILLFIDPFGECRAKIPRRGVIVRIQHREKHIGSDLSTARCLVATIDTVRHAWCGAKTALDPGTVE